jgi:4-amino-4-deoxy-L-arabinose transferase-like glycosyltransferase
MSKLTIHILLTIVAALLLLPGLGLVPLFDWDELNFAESAREMALTNNWWYVQMGFEPFWEKPPLAIIFQALAVNIFGDHSWVYRLPNAVAGIVTVNFVYHVGEYLGRRMLGIFWAITLLCTFATFIYWKSAIIDPVFNLLIVLSLWNWYKISRAEIHGERSHIYYLLSGLFIALATLTKGQAALIIFLAIIGWITLYRGRWHDLLTGKFFLFLLPIFILVGGWVFKVYQLLGSSFFVSFFSYQQELIRGQFEWHTQPWFYHIVVLLILCFPSSAIAVKYLTKKGEEDYILESWHFLMRSMFWIVLLIFSIVSTKIIHYSSLCWWPITYFAAYHCYLVYTNRAVTTSGQKLWLILSGFILCIVLWAGPIALNWVDWRHSRWFSSLDSYAIAILESGPWSTITLLPGLILFIGIVFIVKMIFQTGKKEFMEGNLLLITLLVAIASYTLLLPSAANTLQNPLSLYIKKLNHKQILIENQGFKTYAIYYHGKFTPRNFTGSWFTSSAMVRDKIKGHPYPKQEARKVWIRDGEPSEPSYLITKNTYKPDLYFLHQFKQTDSFIGYRVWKRK